LAFLAFFNFFSIRLTDAWLHRLATVLSSRNIFPVYPMNVPSKQTGLEPLRRAFAFLFFFMDNPAFLIFIMAQAHGQMPSM